MRIIAELERGAAPWVVGSQSARICLQGRRGACRAEGSRGHVGHVGQKARAGTHAAIGTGRVPLADWHLSVGRRVECGAIATLSKF